MRLARFFIDRPIFAVVLSLVTVAAGLIAIAALPVSEYPEVTPPTVAVRAIYPGANPTVLAQTVSTPLEEAINGVDNMLYMSSQATADGVLNLTVTFAIGTDVDLAQVQVQNRVNQALPRLPEEVRALGVITDKQSPDITMVVHLVSPEGRYDPVYLRNYALLQVRNELSRLPGAGQVMVFGAGDYAMRVWLDPTRVAARGLSASDVVRAIRAQNLQVAAGVVGGQPMPSPVAHQLTVNAHGRLADEAEFGGIIVKTGDNGEVTRLRDVARIELGAGEFGLRSMLDNKPAAAIVVFQAPGSNALALSNSVRSTMDELETRFPQGVEWSAVYDPTIFVRESIREVIVTLLLATVMVVIVVVLFLQTWRASIIPLAAVPVSVVGTFAVMLAAGFSINTLSLFGLVLAIGIVVDDAIVVVENVERHIEDGMSPLEASYKAMEEVSRPIIAIALVLCAVFVPVAFVSGLTGQFYQQFALTIAFSTLISAVNSLTLSPALAAVLLKPRGAPADLPTRVLERLLGWLFHPFNRLFARSSARYGAIVGRVIRRTAVPLGAYAVLVAVGIVGFTRVPPGFVPTQDKQYVVAVAQLPDAASLDRTDAVIRRMASIALEQPGVEAAVQFPGLSVNGFVNMPNAGIVFITLDPFHDRGSKDRSAGAIVQALNMKFSSIQDAFVAVFPPPAVNGLGAVGGFKLQLEDRAGLGDSTLYATAQAIVGRAYQTPQLAGIFSSFQINVPQLFADVDRDRAMQQGVALSDLFQTLQIYLGSAYVNDFNKFGRTYQVIAQADAQFRATPEHVAQFKVRNTAGTMVPLGSMLSLKPSYGPDQVSHYNGYPSADINGSAAPGVSSGEAVETMERLVAEMLPNGMGWEWTELTYQQKLAGSTMLIIFPLCVLLVFLVLAALYESFTLPIAILLIVPMTLLSAIAGVWLTKGDNNVFTQIGLLVLMGLACKNAILIVEFARDLERQGRDRWQAVLEASRIRMRPILMTSFAFIMGVVPLVIATGAGAEMRRVMGVVVFSGMLGVTFFGLLFTPVFYVVIRGLTSRRSARTAVLAASLAGCAGAPAYQPSPVAVAPAYRIASDPVAAARTDSTSVGVAPVASRSATFTSSTPQSPFWQVLGDPTLEALIAQAARANTDVRQAESRLTSARAARRLSAFDLAPTITASGGARRAQSALAQTPGLTQQLPRQELWDVGFDASWELDIFGRVSRTVQAQSALVASAEHSLDDVQVSLEAEIARTYFELRGAQRQLTVALANASLQRRTVTLTEERLAAGRGTAFDTERAKAELQLTLAVVPGIEARIAAATHRIAVLVGRTPGTVTIAAPDSASEAKLPDTLDIGSPRELVRRRPDVLRAERELAAQRLLVSAAQMEYLPTLSLGATVGYAATSLDSLGRTGTRRFVVGPTLSWPLLDLGRVRTRVDISQARSEEARAQYSATVLRAVEETETALVTYDRSHARLAVLSQAVRSSTRAVELAQQRFDAGLTDLLQLLDAQRTQLQAESQLAQGRTDAASALVAIYKAIGGKR
jgi:hydrophobe/amphiphile efflux-1 (HAE1) family protein/NodT family efflux transporter outer membrane factor (OMF) lipoprotein